MVGTLSIALMVCGLAVMAFCVMERKLDWFFAFGAFMVAVSTWIMVCH